MAKNLVIVESPAKAKTIEKFLGSDYKVMSSYGHIADLPDKELGVDVAHGFKPQYLVAADKRNLVKALKEEVKKADTVWLASDEDREGEAIAWHLSEELKLSQEKTKRIVFNSITKSAIEHAIKNPRGIDYNLVNAQQARRVLDRLVGYELSPVLWKKIRKGLSAGRVQSVSVRLIVEREREIQDFQSEVSYKITAEFLTKEGKLIKTYTHKSFPTQEAAKAFLEKNIGATFSVGSLETKPAKKSPAPPFTTSTLQQEAARKLHFSVSKTMQLAQRLYESGLITYMRTDSVNLSPEALSAAKQEIVKSYGEAYSKTRQYTSHSKGAQEAHEAIRPTDMAAHTVRAEGDQVRLYELIWKRTIASQMSDASLERTQVKVNASTHTEPFIGSGEVIVFDGFLKVYLEGKDDEEEEDEGMLPAMKVGESLTSKHITATQRFTRPPFRYTEASLVKKLEELGMVVKNSKTGIDGSVHKDRRLLTGDTAVNRDAPVLVVTTEVVRNMLFANAPEIDEVGCVVLDEVHYLADRERGPVWEEVVLALPEPVRLVSLSATIANVDELAAWMGSVHGRTEVVTSEVRPVPLVQHVCTGRRLVALHGRGSEPSKALVSALQGLGGDPRARLGNRDRRRIISLLEERDMLLGQEQPLNTDRLQVPWLV